MRIKLNWRTSSQTPGTDKPITAVIAIKDGTDWYMSSIYIWRAGIGWRHERKSTPPPHNEFAWIPESELLETIQLPPPQ